MGEPDLRLVDADSVDRCGARTSDGSPCMRRTGGGRCHDHPGTPSAGPPPPDYLGEYARQEWRRRIRELASAGLVDRVDLGLLECLCDVYEEVRACREHLNEHGRTIPGRGGAMKKNPAHSKLLKFRKEYRLCQKDLKAQLESASPESPDEAPDDPWSEW